LPARIAARIFAPSMKIAYVIKRIVPAHDETGSSVASWAIVKSAQKLGHDVIIISYDIRRPRPGRAGVPIEKVYSAADAARKEGFKVFVLEEEKTAKKLSERFSKWWQSIRKVLSPRPDDVYNGFRYTNRIRTILRDEKVEVAWVWAADGASAVHSSLPELQATVVSLTDLDHVAREARRDRLKSEGSILDQISYIRQKFSDRKLQEQVVDLVKPFDLVINHAFHHGQWWIDRGIRHLQYFPIPVLPNNSISGLIDHSTQNNCKIVLVGYVTGNATLPGLKLLGEEIAPSLEKTLSPEELARLEILHQCSRLRRKPSGRTHLEFHCPGAHADRTRVQDAHRGSIHVRRLCHCPPSQCQRHARTQTWRQHSPRRDWP
jgi:hypothetical protein